MTRQTKIPRTTIHATSQKDSSRPDPGSSSDDGSRGVALVFHGDSAARVVFLACLVFELALVLFDYHVNYGHLTDIGAIRRLANIAREDGLASWFASTQTLMVGLTAWIYWLGARAGLAASWRQVGWCLVAVLFTFMAFDDGAQIHERLGTALGESRSQVTSRFPSFTWHLLFVPLYGAAGAVAVAFLWRELGTRRATGFLASAFLLFGFAVGLDFFEGLEANHPWNVYSAVATRFDLTEFAQTRFREAPYDMLLHFSRSLEEFAEMLGITCVWTALVGHAGKVMPTVRFPPHA
jgi:hypothetical protein